ncbi:ubiquitin carboxyl-terminal hydrolase 37 isoform X1 [Ictalurus punctatus]|uniref:Ubiquitin carboxyl-terminal hydrolase n=1 Tax=Ictalurus punctatus TaxID=7998 RepID=A0A9F7RJ56_ICTPU|nr:ubiquitin carboxyl-terminal hydrolase 37 isoform X1 [Ictalurus punctatus]XP_053537761.1 ubiquitin carboxyl-terminal hydrolase 37 isoform X1 [Ictalurus punctatus]
METTNTHLQNSLRIKSMIVERNNTTLYVQEKETIARKETALNRLNVKTVKTKPTSKFPGTKYTRAKEVCVRTYLQSSEGTRKKMTLPCQESKASERTEERKETIPHKLESEMAELNEELEELNVSSYMEFTKRVPYACAFSSNEMMPEGSTKSPNPTASGGTIQSQCRTPSDRIINIMTSIYTLFSDTDFDSKLLPGGLPNFGSNCYVNASLQCLFTAESFCRELSDLLDNSTHTLEYSFLRCFVELSRLRNSSEVQGDSDMSLFLQALIISATEYNPEFTIDIQNDAHEFLCYCLTQMEESGRKLGWQEDVNPRCPVTSNFKFKMRNIITCYSCGSQQNNNVEVFNHVSVPLKHDSVDRCLSDVVHKRTLLESKCKVCGGDSASSRWTFHTLPRFLILQLNRFRMTEYYTVQKVETPVDITPELQINCFPQSDTPRIENSRAEARETDRNELSGSTSTYRLISVLNHIGRTACFGHYVSDCSSHNSHQWKIYNDHLVRLTSETDVLERRSTSAYVLLYERVSTG